MAYGNWGAKVYRNGKRERHWEDATPYKELEYEPGYHQAFGLAIPACNEKGELIKKAGDDLGVHHAVLGSGRVRLCGYKCYAVLFVDGAAVNIEPFLAEGEEIGDRSYKGTVEGHEFTATERSNFVDLWLREPDGTQWMATCGYMYGAGHED